MKTVYSMVAFLILSAQALALEPTAFTEENYKDPNHCGTASSCKVGSVSYVKAYGKHCDEAMARASRLGDAAYAKANPDPRRKQSCGIVGGYYSSACYQVCEGKWVSYYMCPAPSKSSKRKAPPGFMTPVMMALQNLR